eukprot:GFYU01009729.1.p1 GENE.GFYU01009729.1~~GFYU01009729.1.p1  ORF type:complete len:1118 (+),score=287.92 GFYU01009729.1:68-3355(+)
MALFQSRSGGRWAALLVVTVLNVISVSAIDSQWPSFFEQGVELPHSVALPSTTGKLLRHVDSLRPSRTITDVDKLAVALNTAASTTVEKVIAAFYWTARNIRYSKAEADFVKERSNVYDTAERRFKAHSSEGQAYVRLWNQSVESIALMDAMTNIDDKTSVTKLAILQWYHKEMAAAAGTLDSVEAKLRALHAELEREIIRNHLVARRPTTEQLVDTVIRNKIGICQDYTRVFCALLAKSSIDCEYIGGHTRTPNHIPGQGKGGSHAWALVYLSSAEKRSGSGHLFDPTWASGSFGTDETYEFYEKPDEFYMFTKPEHFLITHFPETPAHQLLRRPVSFDTFDSLPIVTSAYFKVGFDYVLTDKCQVSAVAGTYKTHLRADNDNVAIYASVSGRRGADDIDLPDSNEMVLAQVTANPKVFDLEFRLRQRAEFRATVWGRLPRSDKWAHLQTILVSSDGRPSPGLKLFPTTSNHFHELKGRLIEPMEPLLRAGTHTIRLALSPTTKLMDKPVAATVRLKGDRKLIAEEYPMEIVADKAGGIRASAAKRSRTDGGSVNAARGKSGLRGRPAVLLQTDMLLRANGLGKNEHAAHSNTNTHATATATATANTDANANTHANAKTESGRSGASGEGEVSLTRFPPLERDEDGDVIVGAGSLSLDRLKLDPDHVKPPSRLPSKPFLPPLSPSHKAATKAKKSEEFPSMIDDRREVIELPKDHPYHDIVPPAPGRGGDYDYDTDTLSPVPPASPREGTFRSEARDSLAAVLESRNNADEIEEAQDFDPMAAQHDGLVEAVTVTGSDATTPEISRAIEVGGTFGPEVIYEAEVIVTSHVGIEISIGDRVIVKYESDNSASQELEQKLARLGAQRTFEELASTKYPAVNLDLKDHYQVMVSEVKEFFFDVQGDHEFSVQAQKDGGDIPEHCGMLELVNGQKGKYKYTFAPPSDGDYTVSMVVDRKWHPGKYGYAVHVQAFGRTARPQPLPVARQNFMTAEGTILLRPREGRVVVGKNSPKMRLEFKVGRAYNNCAILLKCTQHFAALNRGAPLATEFRAEVDLTPCGQGDVIIGADCKYNWKSDNGQYSYATLIQYEGVLIRAA